VLGLRDHYARCAMDDARILLVEDDADLREAMAAALSADGHAVRDEPDGDRALEALADAQHDLVLLDVALGAGPDGVEVCRRLRRVDTDVYVMMLTARDSEAEVVLALEAGADDYVTKPIGIAELRSRVRAALRRVRRPGEAANGGDGADGRLRHGDVTLDQGSRVARVGEGQLDLTRSELAVLEALLLAAGSVRSRAQLLQAIFGDDAYRDPRAVDVHVHHIREKLETAGGDAAVLVTVRGAGYRLGP
jgi:DNA-binding response OmpR family regulator